MGDITVDLALILKDRTIEISPRDRSSQEWLQNGSIFTDMPIGRIRDAWKNRGIAKSDLRVISAQLEQDLNDERAEYERLYPSHIVRFRVRACEYRPVVTTEELVEL